MESGAGNVENILTTSIIVTRVFTELFQNVELFPLDNSNVY